MMEYGASFSLHEGMNFGRPKAAQRANPLKIQKGAAAPVRRSLVIFDLDGTLLNTLEDLAGSVNHALRKEGFPPRSVEEIRGFIGNGIDRLLRQSAPEYCSEEKFRNLKEAFREHYVLHAADTTLPYPGIPQLLDELHREGYILAVISNKKDSAVRSLCSSLLPPLFHAVLGEKANIPRKPAPDMVFHTADVLKIPLRQALYVGDSDVDILTAQNAGIPCLSVTWGYRTKQQLLLAGAKKTVDSPAEILQFLSSAERTV